MSDRREFHYRIVLSWGYHGAVESRSKHDVCERVRGVGEWSTVFRKTPTAVRLEPPTAGLGVERRHEGRSPIVD